MKVIRLRPHHSLCMQFFVGKGYSEEFTKHMWEVVKLAKDTMVEVTFDLDELCSACPNHETGICDSQEHVAEIDKKVAEVFGYQEGDRLTLERFWENSKVDIILPGRLKEICGECEFMGICEAQAEKIIENQS